MLRMLLSLGAVAFLSGCASGGYCLGEQPYMKAQSVPPLTPAEGLKLPESSGALKIPPPPKETVPYGQKVKDEKGDEVVQCLDKPPAMPKSAEEKPATPPVEEKKG
jgi:uncharacterized lipoprotein